MDTDALTQFILTARAKTYAGDSGKTEPLLKDSRQHEYTEGEFLYRDIYYVGAGRFTGLETVYWQDKPVWTMSYFGNFSAMSEAAADTILREALIAKKDETRLWTNVEWEKDDFRYTYDGQGSIEELGGEEEIHKGDARVYYFYCAGGLID